jgi:hypothetical protein
MNVTALFAKMLVTAAGRELPDHDRQVPFRSGQFLITYGALATERRQ